MPSSIWLSVTPGNHLGRLLKSRTTFQTSATGAAIVPDTWIFGIGFFSTQQSAFNDLAFSTQHSALSIQHSAFSTQPHNSLLDFEFIFWGSVHCWPYHFCLLNHISLVVQNLLWLSAEC